MKKYLLTSIILLTGLTGFSQFNKGNILVGGSTNAGFGISTSKSKFSGTTVTNGKTTSFNLQPQAGYFLADNILIGTGLNLSLFSFKPDVGSDKDSGTGISISPFGRYYFSKLYAQVGFELGSEKFKQKNGNVTTENTNGLTGFSVAVGYPIMLNESVALEPQLGYQTLTRKNKDTDVKGIDGGLFFSIGVYGYLSNLGKK